MQSINLIRDNLKKSRDLVLLNIDGMKEHAFVFPTPRGGAHTLWVLGHLAYIEGLVIRQLMLGERNPLADWEASFDGTDVASEAQAFPPFDEVIAKCREMRQGTIALIDSMSEEDLDKPSSEVPKGWDKTFGTYRHCLQYLADHWYMHRGQLADARRAAGLDRMWV
ncbi:DinB family protein [bacterium]|nr:DinB family protein [bacterium]